MEDVVELKKQNNKKANLRDLLVRRKVPIKQWNVDLFFKIIDEGLDDFLESDRCYKLADKYLVAMVFMYFLRASFLPEEYTRINFFIALYLAHDMEEDDEDTRTEIQLWASTSGRRNIWTPSFLLNQRERLFTRMGFRAVVSRACCEALMHLVKPDHAVWQRQRHPVHAGANPRYHRVRNVCPNCIDAQSPRSS